MNRIIIIGNGFDIAHKMGTSYREFLSKFWKDTIKKIHETTNTYEDDFITLEHIPETWLAGYEYSTFIKTINNSPKSILTFRNNFLKVISDKNSLKNWVDIENEYYSLLKKCNPDNDSEIKTLNIDFNKIKELLVKYLIQIEDNYDKSKIHRFSTIKRDITNKIYSDFNLRDFSNGSINKRIDIEYKEYLKNSEGISKGVDYSDLNLKNKEVILKLGLSSSYNDLRNLLISKDAKDIFDLNPKQTLILNFNYTETESFYTDGKNNVEVIRIHGSLYEEENPIIFGYGDELDRDYKRIENINDNNYLENIKSIKYLETENYKKLLEYVNSNSYQVFIMGHSCGVSDRTLLNTIFENENCSSIKLFYHKKKDKTDNYNDIIKNISRNFNDKTMMRDRVVNKTYSEPLT